MELTNIIWNIQNELRKEGITGIDAMHHITMIFISRSIDSNICNKLNIPIDLSFNNMINENDNNRFYKFWNTDDFENCLYYYIRDILDLGYDDISFQISSPTVLGYCYSEINKINTNELFDKVDLIGDIYEHFINREGKSMKDLGQYFTDRTLIKYLVKMIDPKFTNNNIENVWDPAAGTGGFLIEYISYLNNKYNNINWHTNKHEIYGNDINKTTSSLLKQNLYYSFKELCSTSITMQDSLTVNSSMKYDNILANPPFGVKGLKYKDMNCDIKSLNINGTKGELLFLQLCMSRLKDEGKCIIVVPEGVLFNNSRMYKGTRKYLLDNFNLKKIIKVGDGEFFKNTSVKTAVLFFEKKGKTKLVDFIQVNKVNNNIKEIPLMKVNINDIISNEYSLNMNLYIKDDNIFDVNIYNTLKIHEIVSNVVNDKLNKSDITEDFVECINIGCVESNCNKYKKYKIQKNEYKNKSLVISNKNDILISSVRPKLNKVIFVNENTLYCSGFIVIRCKDYYTSKYLYNIIKSKYVNDKFINISENSSSMYPTINYNSIKDIKIPYYKLERNMINLVNKLDKNDNKISELENSIKSLKDNSKSLINFI